MRKVHIGAAALVAAAGVGSASAQLVEITFSGSITGFQDTRLLPFELQRLLAGDPFAYSVVMDVSMGTGIPDAGYLLEEDGYVSSHLTLGALSSAVSMGHFDGLEVGDDQEGVDFLATTGFGTGGAALFTADDIVFVSADLSMTALAAPAIPTMLDEPALPPDFENFLYQTPFTGLGQGAVFGNVTRVTARVVPGPGAATFIGFACVALASRRRR